MLGAVLPALLAGCTVGPSDRPAVLARDGGPQQNTTTPREEAPLPPLGEQSGDMVPWTGCDKRTRQALDAPQRRDAGAMRYSCATIPSTLDTPQLPDRGVIRISVLKAESGSGGSKIPLLVVNDIDGEPGTVFAARLAARLPNELLDRFAIIGVDRRGTGGSNPISCVPRKARSDLLGFDPAAPDIDPLVTAARDAGQECALILKNMQGALDTWRTAGDLDEIRRRLGAPFLHVLARGEGSRVVQSYAQRFTDKLGRVVLDGVPDPSEQAETVLEGQAAGAEAALDAFAGDCRTRNCPLGDDPRATVSRLLDRLRHGDRGLAPGAATRAILTGLGEPDRWPALAKATDAALHGDVRPLDEFLGPQDTDNPYPSVLDATLATTCNDTRTRLAPQHIAELSADWRQKYPVFGGLLAQRLVWCSQWPVRREPVANPAMRGAPPVLVVSTAADPRTPALGTMRAAQQMPSSVRIGWEGAGHGAVGRSDCVTEQIMTFLADGAVPSQGVTCPP
ncbi:MAG: alpha/beta fold hydrolase [Actinophytocola sp.]|nr:alpha/beta fold hydrolase [Actinophytocola sp.]